MSKFKQLLALATRLLEMEETAIVLRSEVLTLQDSHDRIATALAEANRFVGDKNKLVQSLEQKLKSAELRVSTPPDRYVKADSLVQGLGYKFVGGFWQKPAPFPTMPSAPVPSPELVLARGRLKTLGYEWNGASWVEMVKPAAPVAVKPPVMPGAPPASSWDVKPAPPVTPMAPAAIPPAECSPGLPKIRNEDCKQEPFTDGDVEPLPRRKPGKKNRCMKCQRVGHFAGDCPGAVEVDAQ